MQFVHGGETSRAESDIARENMLSWAKAAHKQSKPI